MLRYETFTSAIFVQYESALDRTLGATMSLVLVALALSIVATEALTRGRSKYYTSGTGAPRPTALVQLGRWRWPSLIFCASIVSVSLAFPISILGYWLFRGVSAGEPLLILWGGCPQLVVRLGPGRRGYGYGGITRSCVCCPLPRHHQCPAGKGDVHWFRFTRNRHRPLVGVLSVSTTPHRYIKRRAC